MVCWLWITVGDNYNYCPKFLLSCKIHEKFAQLTKRLEEEIHELWRRKSRALTSTSRIETVYLI